MGTIPIINRRHYLEADVLVPWLLNSFYLLFCKLPWTFGIELHCRCIRWGWTLHDQLFSAFWPVASFCTGLSATEESISVEG